MIEANKTVLQNFPKTYFSSFEDSAVLREIIDLSQIRIIIAKENELRDLISQYDICYLDAHYESFDSYTLNGFNSESIRVICRGSRRSLAPLSFFVL